MVYTKRVYAKTNKIFIYGTGSILALITYLMTLSYYGIDITTSGDIKCAGTVEEPCISYINITTSKYAIVFPKSVIYFGDNPPTDYKLYKKDTLGRWRTFNISGKTMANESKWELKLIGYKAINENVKWGIKSGNTDIDPVWVGYTIDDFMPRLISNKADFTSGESVFEFCNPTSFNIPYNNRTVDFIFEKVTGNIKNYEVYVGTKSNITYNETSQIWVSNITTKVIIDTNGTYNITEDNGYYNSIIITKTKETVEYMSLNSTINYVKPKECKNILLRAEWKPVYGENSIKIDWKPKINISNIDYIQDKWAWWNSTWTKRQAINITTNSNLTDYQLLLNITYDSDMNTTFQDIRFTDNTGTISLSYFIENYTASQWATIWVKGNYTNGTVIYEYYGNPTATNNSNGDNTFIFFDDFENNNLNKWNTKSSYKINTNSTTAYTGTYGLNIDDNSSATELINTTLLSSTYIIDFYQKITSNNGIASLQPQSITYLDTTYRLYGYNNGGTYQYRYYNNSFYTLQTMTFNTWYNISMAVAGSSSYIIINNTRYNIIGINNTTILQLMTSAAEQTEVYYDNIKVRKYTATEPTYTFGSEESSGISTCGTITTSGTLTQNVSSTGTCFTIGANNIVLDGAGYTINYSQTTSGYAIDNSGAYDNITIKNLNIVQGSTQSDSYAIYAGNMVNSTINNNSITTYGSNGYGIYFIASSSNNITNNNITTSGSSGGYGIVFASSNTNNIINNKILTSGATGYGIVLGGTDNNVINGSIISQNSYEYVLDTAGVTNNFTNTNFTAQRRIYFVDTASWFNYNNQSNGNIWLKTSISSINQYINRTLINWNNTQIKWNDTSSTTITATYNLTGLIANKYYNFTNQTGSTITAQTISTDSNGAFSVNIALSTSRSTIQALYINDTQAPQFSQNSTNSTLAGTSIKHNLYWTDNVALSGYIFSFDNGNGTFYNDTWVAFTGTTNWSNVTKTVNSTSGSTIRWIIYANDSYNNWNVSFTYSYITTLECGTLSSANTIYTLTSNLSSAGTCFTVGANNITINGNGYTINYSQSSSGYGVNNSGGYDNITIKNLTIIKDSCIAGYSIGIFGLGMSNSIIQNVSIQSGISSCSIGTANEGIDLYQSDSNNITNNTITIYEQGITHVGLKLDESDLNIISNTNITITDLSNIGIYITYSTNNTIIDSNIKSTYSLKSSAYPNYEYSLRLVDSSNIFKNTNFSNNRYILINNLGGGDYSVFNYNDNSTGNVFIKTSISEGINLFIGRSIQKWTNTWIKYTDTPSSAKTIYYNVSGLLTNTNYTIYNKTVLGTTYTLYTSDGSGNINFNIYEDRETNISISQFLNNIVYLNGSVDTQYYELRNMANITSNSNTDNSSQTCLSLDHPDYGDNFFCFTNTSYAEYYLTLIPAQNKFNDSNISKETTTNTTLYTQLNVRDEVQSAKINLSTNGTINDIYVFSGNKTSYDAVILGSINGTVANISNFSDGLSQKTNIFYGASQYLTYIQIPKYSTITSSVFNITSTSASNTQTLIDVNSTSKTNALESNGNMTFNIYLLPSTTITASSINVSGLDYDYIVAPNTYTCSGTNAVSDCANAYDTDYNTYAYMSFSDYNTYSMYGFGNYTTDSSLKNISTRLKTAVDVTGCSSPPISYSYYRKIYVWNYTSSAWVTVYTSATSSGEIYCTSTFNFDDTISNVSSVSGFTSGSNPIQVKYELTGSINWGSGTYRIYDSTVNITSSKAEISLDMLNNGYDNTTNITTGTNTTINLNTTLLTNYLSSCSSSPCPIPFTLTSKQTGTNVSSRNITISGVNIQYNSNPANITIDVGSDRTIDYTYNNVLNSTTSPQLVNISASVVQSYLNSCTTQICLVPIMFYVKQGGNMTINTLEFLYTFNPININSTAFNNYLSGKTGTVNVPIQINSTNFNGKNITASGLNISYYGDANYTITSAYIGNVTESFDTNQMNIVWSNYSLNLPSKITYVEFIKTVNSTNISAFGQTDTIPIFNISYQARDVPMNISIRLNSTLNSCINITVSNSSSKSNGSILTTTDNQIYKLLSLNQSFGIWLWADLNSCSYPPIWVSPYFIVSAKCRLCY